MPTLYHSPHTRSSRIISQLMLTGKLDEVTIVIVDVVKGDGTGGRDDKNPHPEGKVPFLVTDEGAHIRESAAIMMYLDELHGSTLSVAAGTPERGTFLSWMMYYGGVLEPAMVAQFAKIDDPMFAKTFRTMAEVSVCLHDALGDRAFLTGDKLTIADIIMASAFQWAPHLVPDFDTVKAWLARVDAAQDSAALAAFEAQAVAQLSGPA